MLKVEAWVEAEAEVDVKPPFPEVENFTPEGPHSHRTNKLSHLISKQLKSFFCESFLQYKQSHIETTKTWLTKL